MKLIRYVAAGLILNKSMCFVAQDNPKFGMCMQDRLSKALQR